MNNVSIAVQPIFNVESGEVMYLEVLARDNDNENTAKGVIEHVRRKNGYISLDFQMIKRALKVAKETKRKYLICVNIFGETLDNYGVCNLLMDTLSDEEKAYIDNVIIEINEESNTDSDIVTENIEFLHSNGFKIALDDFGVGRMCLDKLMKLNYIYMIKVDRAFVKDKYSNQDVKDMVIKMLISVSKKFGIVLVVEGVEDTKQYASIKTSGCDCVQGYLLEKPMKFTMFMDKYFDEST